MGLVVVRLWRVIGDVIVEAERTRILGVTGVKYELYISLGILLQYIQIY